MWEKRGDRPVAPDKLDLLLERLAEVEPKLDGLAVLLKQMVQEEVAAQMNERDNAAKEASVNGD